jgi:hypothetical protein
MHRCSDWGRAIISDPARLHDQVAEACEAMHGGKADPDAPKTTGPKKWAMARVLIGACRQMILGLTAPGA